MTRDEVQKLMRSARTLAQIADARKAQLAYLEQHPDDEGLREEGEMLYMRESALRNSLSDERIEAEKVA